MSEPTILDQAFHVIMKKITATGRAPFYTELATELSVPFSKWFENIGYA